MAKALLKAGRVALVMLIFLAGTTLNAAIDTYEFKDEQTRQRFHRLTEELRCPKCQNQNLADSNAPIATDLRGEVYRLLSEGNSDREVKHYLVDRYGEYVLYKPEWSAQTWLLWLAPAIFLVLAAMVLVVIIKRRARASAQVADNPLSEQEQKEIEQLLQQDLDKES